MKQLLRLKKFYLKTSLCILINSLIQVAIVYGSGHGGGAANKSDQPTEQELSNKQEEGIITDKSDLLIRKLSDINYKDIGSSKIINMITAKVIALSPDIMQDNILEIGSNFGGAVNLLYQNGYSNITGIDKDKSAIEYAKSKYPKLNFIQSDISKITDIFEDDFFSFIYMIDYSYTVKDKALLLQKIKSVAKKDAIFAMVEYSENKPHINDSISPTDNKDTKSQHSSHEQNSSPLKKNPLLKYPINLDQFKLVLKFTNWEIVEVIDASSEYIKYSREILEKISEQSEMLKALGYSKAEIQLVCDNLLDLIKQLEGKNFSRIILLVRKH